MELLFLIAVGFAFKSAFDHVRTTRKASESARLKEVAKTFSGGKVPKRKLKSAARRHDIGWWAGEVGHGFPVARQGWHAGWLGHRAESEAHRARVEEARTRHAEAQTAALADLPGHKARRDAAQKRRDEILERLKGQPGEAKGSREAVQEAADEVAAKRAEKQAAATPPLPSDTVDQKAAPGPYVPPTRRPDGDTEPDTSDPAEDHAPGGDSPSQQAPAPPTQGDTMSADTTYDSAVAQAKALAASADEDLATIRKRQEELSATSDAMQAVDVDPATLSDLMDLLDRYKALEQEAKACGEGAQSIADGLAKRHGGLNQAHQDAPVRAANRDFYEG